jgi:hypothetical protein
MYFKDKDPETEQRCISDGVIYSIRTNGVLVFIPRYVISKAMVNKKSQDWECSSVVVCDALT